MPNFTQMILREMDYDKAQVEKSAFQRKKEIHCSINHLFKEVMNPHTYFLNVKEHHVKHGVPKEHMDIIGAVILLMTEEERASELGQMVYKRHADLVQDAIDEAEAEETLEHQANAYWIYENRKWITDEVYFERICLDSCPISDWDARKAIQMVMDDIHPRVKGITQDLTNLGVVFDKDMLSIKSDLCGLPTSNIYVALRILGGVSNVKGALRKMRHIADLGDLPMVEMWSRTHTKAEKQLSDFVERVENIWCLFDKEKRKRDRVRSYSAAKKVLMSYSLQYVQEIVRNLDDKEENPFSTDPFLVAAREVFIIKLDEERARQLSLLLQEKSQMCE